MDLAKESSFLLEKHVSPYGWIMIGFHIAISAGNILILPTRNWECLLATLWTEEIHCSPTKLFAKQAGCFILKDTSKTKDMTSLMDRAIAKVNQNELDRYEKLFNTAYGVSKNNWPFSDYTLLYEIQIKNSLHLGSDHLDRARATLLTCENKILNNSWIFH